MRLARLVIITCCALAGFALGRWFSPPAGPPAAAEPRPADSQAAPPQARVELPPPARAGRVPFVEIFRSLRSSSSQEHVAYLHSVEELPNGPDRRAALIAFFQCMASINVQEAADLVPQVGKDDLQRVVDAVLGATAAADTPILVKMLLDLPADVDPKSREQKLNSQMFFWAALDPTAAAQFVDQYQSIYPDLASYGILQGLAVADPASAERWLKEHPDLRKQPEAMSNYIRGLYQNNPASARQYVTEHATDEALLPGLKGVARFTFLSSADDALEFITHLPTNDARRAALGAILDTNNELFVNSETSQTALCAGLAEWVTKFSQDDWPPTLSQFLRQWRELDPPGPVNWMANLPSATRSAVAVEFVRRLRSDEMRQVLASTAGDFHHDLLNGIAKTLSQAPADRRQSLIESLELPPEDAAQLAPLP